MLLVAALAAGGVALAARSSADHQAASASAERLGAQALIQPPLDLSLLAREAVNLDDSLATRGYLLAALLRAPAAIAIAHEGGGSVYDEALSPDGRTLAVRGDDGNIVFFDTRTMNRSGGVPLGDEPDLVLRAPKPAPRARVQPRRKDARGREHGRA